METIKGCSVYKRPGVWPSLTSLPWSTLHCTVDTCASPQPPMSHNVATRGSQLGVWCYLLRPLRFRIFQPQVNSRVTAYNRVNIRNQWDRHNWKFWRLWPSWPWRCMYLIFIGVLQPLKSCPDNVYQLNTKLSEYCRDRNAAGGDGDRFVKNLLKCCHRRGRGHPG